jgi:hypothetical protein
MVFNDYVSTANASVATQTNASLNDVLGFYDQLAIQVVVDDTTAGAAPAALTVQIAHSADDRNYVFKNAAPEVSTPTQLNIGTPTYMSFGYDGGASPSLGLVRLVLVLTAAAGPVRAHVKITVTGNNLNEQAFTRVMATGMNAQTAASKKYVLMYGSGQKIATSAIAELVQFINNFPTLSDAQLHVAQAGNLAEARAFQMWQPLLILKNAGGFNGPTVTVPEGFMIAFLGTGRYALVKGSVGLWESKHSSTGLFPSREYHLANPSVSSASTWSPPPGNNHSGPGFTTGGNPTQGDVKFEQPKGK